MVEPTSSERAGQAPSEDDRPTGQLAPVDEESSEAAVGPSLLGSKSFFRLWVAQIVSALGDWIGLTAILALAARVGGSSPEAAVGIVMSARMIPGFFLASVGGVLVDRWDRKRVMVACDVGRGLVMASLPFIRTVWGLFIASLLLEVLSLLWSPAKEASVPNLVPMERLSTANSLSLVAAYGTFPLGAALFASLTKVAEWSGRHASSLRFLNLNQESLAIYVDVVTFFVSALLISTLTLKRPEKRGSERIDLSRAFDDLKDGWRFIGSSPVVRSVMVGLGTGLVGGGMVAPLGPTFSARVLHGGSAGFGLLLTALGCGVAAGVLALSTLQSRVSKQRLFPFAVLGAGATMAAAASMSTLGPTMVFIAGMGVCAGAVYVLGFTILQENVEDELRGRTFATLYTLVRLCLLVSLTLAPLLAGLLDGISSRYFDRSLQFGRYSVNLPGVRLTLWLGAAIILVAGALAVRGLRPTAGSDGKGE